MTYVLKTDRDSSQNSKKKKNILCLEREISHFRRGYK